MCRVMQGLCSLLGWEPTAVREWQGKHLAKLKALALCVYRTVRSKPLGREEVVRSAVGEALGGSLLLVLACASGSS